MITPTGNHLYGPFTLRPKTPSTFLSRWDEGRRDGSQVHPTPCLSSYESPMGVEVVGDSLEDHPDCPRSGPGNHPVSCPRYRPGRPTHTPHPSSTVGEGQTFFSSYFKTVVVGPA